MIRTFTLSLLLLALIPATVGCTSKDEKRDVQAQNIAAPEELPEIRLEKAFPKVEFNKPLAMVAQPGKGEWLHVVEQLGRIYRIKNDAKSSVKEIVLDLTDRIPTRRRNMEEGLLAFRFHPEFKDNGYAFVSYSMHKGGGKPRRGVLSRFTFKDKKFDTSTEKIILEVKQPYGNHNGCEILFGDDGFLFASFGDGGAAHDPHDNGQNKNTILGSIIRIDVDKQDEGKAYAIPEDNPFVKEKDARGEIWAYGLRNVWRMAFDRKTGLLWAGDVGQNAWEEIDIIEKGGNYGWNVREGKHEFQGRKKTPEMI
ncbi:MAG: PQQ-dependent sugar dehydrogenase, partial [Planctomycetota bacterium]